MQTKIIESTPSAFSHPLLIKNLLTTPLIYSPQQKIVYRDLKEITYSEFGSRVCQLAHGLNNLGVKAGDTVAVMDWDSNRYLECYFAVPMIGAILHTVNVRLSSEQLLYTINHAEDDVILVNSEFLPLLEAIKDKLSTVKKIVLLTDSEVPASTSIVIDHEYEAMLQENPREYSFLDFDENSIATTFYTTGTTGLPKGVSPIIDECNLEGWKVMIGGSALSSGMCKTALDRGVNIYTAYGMSETCPLLTVANLKSHMLEWNEDDQIRIRCRTGLPVSNVQLEIVDVDGNPVAHDGKAVGEVVVRSPWLTQGYLKDPEKSEELWAGGWLHTGDIGFIDEEGYLQITDRLKDVIKTGGEWISSLELEDIISQHPGVSEVAVVGVPDQRWGERPLAIVVLKEMFKEEVTEKDIKDFCMTFVEKGVIPKFGVPSEIILNQEIPKTSVGKISKKDIRGLYK